ncbi:hypothetical protein [Celeribacter sp.]|uniref:hypothetical protein n=1 Tax=Celeribacter sp. TaxID=1890673 RepID=UPI003A8EEFE9
MTIEAYRELVAHRLEAQRDAIAQVLSRACEETRDTSSEHAHEGAIILRIEVSRDGLSYAFPVSAWFDGKTDRPDPSFDGFAPLISQAEEDQFIVWEEGPEAPQHALEQPVIDAANVEATVIAPFIVALARECGLQDAPFGVEVGLHDSRDVTLICEPAGGMGAYEAQVKADITVARDAIRARAGAARAASSPSSSPSVLARIKAWVLGAQNS